MSTLKTEVLAVRTSTLLRQPFDGRHMYYTHVEDFYRESQSLILASADLERLRLYFELQYGENCLEELRA
jgi:hypothetical protein